MIRLSLIAVFFLMSVAQSKVVVERDSRLGEARHFAEGKNWTGVIEVLGPILNTEVVNLDVLSELSKAYFYLGKRKEGLLVLRDGISKVPPAERKTAQDRYYVACRVFLSNKNFQLHQAGLDLLERGEWKLARDKFETVLKEEPLHLSAMIRLGQSELMENDYSNAEEVLKQARDLDSEDAVIRLWLGRALHLAGKLQEANGELKLAKKKLANHEVTNLWLADNLMALGDRAGALALWEENLKTDPYGIATKIRLCKYSIDPQATAATQYAEHCKKIDSALLLSRDKQNASKVEFDLNPLRISVLQKEWDDLKRDASFIPVTKSTN